MVFPAVKLATLLVRQLSKPLANTLKNQAARHEGFKSLCNGFAQRYHKFDMTIKIRFLGHNPTNIQPLTDTKAVAYGADVLAELFVFAVAGSVIMFEYGRSSYKDSQKETKLAAVLQEVHSEISSLKNSVAELQSRNQELVAFKNSVQQQRSLFSMWKTSTSSNASSTPSPSTSLTAATTSDITNNNIALPATTALNSLSKIP